MCQTTNCNEDTWSAKVHIISNEKADHCNIDAQTWPNEITWKDFRYPVKKTMMDYDGTMDYEPFSH